MHHIIDKPPHTRGIYTGTDGEDPGLLPDEEPLMTDTMDRVAQWLLNTEAEPHPDEVMQPWEGEEWAGPEVEGPGSKKAEPQDDTAVQVLPKTELLSEAEATTQL